jgi:MFS transporter, putative metabolite:H+ symporter
VLVPLLGWKILFLLGGIPGLIVTVLLLRLPESPRWLIGQGRFDEAEAIIGNVEASARRKYPDMPEVELARSEAVVVPAAAPFKPVRSRWSELLSPLYRGRTLIAWVLWASAFFVANGLNNWMPTLYHTVYALDLHDSLRAASLTNVAQVAILLACAFCIDKVGRRRWAVASFLIGGALMAALTMVGTGSLATVIVLASLAYGAVGSINAVLYLYTPEIYPTRMRAIGTGLATSWLRLASAVGPALVGLIMTTQGIASVFLMFAIVAMLGALAASRMLETRDRQLEDIAS